MKDSLKKLMLGCAGIALLGLGGAASAAVVGLETADAKGWVLENYNGGPVVIWNSGAVCTTGGPALTLVNTNTAEVNRLWTVIVTSKTTNAPVFIRYRNENCTIESFGFR